MPTVQFRLTGRARTERKRTRKATQLNFEIMSMEERNGCERKALKAREVQKAVKIKDDTSVGDRRMSAR